MLSKDLFQEIIVHFSVNFGFEVVGEDGRIYKSMVYRALKDKISDSDFEKAASAIVNQTSLEDWNKAYGYKGRPAVADWVNAIVPKSKMIEKTKYYKCEVTGATLVKRVLVEEKEQLELENEK